MLTQRDKIILKFMEDVGLGLTIQQAAMFFPRKFAYDYARQRMKKLWEMGAIKRYTSDYSNELIYYLDRKPSYHDNAILNIYAAFINAGYEVKDFRHELQLVGGKYRADGIIKAENEKEIRIALIEVDRYCSTNVRKYEEVYNLGDLQRKYGVFPMVIILSDVDRNYKSNHFEIVRLDIKCTDFQKVLM